MGEKELAEALKKALVELTPLMQAWVKSAIDGAVPFAWVAIIVGALVTCIGILWAWGFGLSSKFAAKIEEMNAASMAREDAREKAAREQCNLEKAEIEKKLERCEAARDMAIRANEATLRDAHSTTLKALGTAQASIDEASTTIDAAITIITTAKKGA